MALAEGLATGDYRPGLRSAIDQNRHMMKARGGGAPWISIDQGKLGVRFRDETGRLPAGLPTCQASGASRIFSTRCEPWQSR